MPSNEILEEVWRIKNRLWEEAGGDMRVFCGQLEEWSKHHMPAEMNVMSVEEFQRMRDSDSILSATDEAATGSVGDRVNGSNEILEEVWRIKEKLSEEAGGDMKVFYAQLQDWSKRNLPPGMKVVSVDEMERWRERQLAPREAAGEDPSAYGKE